MQIAYLVIGSTGAGKTTYARQLASNHNAQVFSIDEWMNQLFRRDLPATPELNWVLERVRRCEDQIWLIAKRLLDAGIPIVFDLGFSRKEQRTRFKSLIEQSGHRAEFHFLNIPVVIRRQRVIKRNTEKTGTYEFEVDEKMFDWMETFFETPDADELRDGVVVTA